MPNPPHPLELYHLAVQHPLAEVAFIEHCWAHFHRHDIEPLLLREDFAGSCAVSAAWCASAPDRQAMAIELDQPTAQWAATRFDHPDLHILAADVMAIDEPRVEVTLALNFSALIYHEPDALLAYLQHARRALEPGGLFIMDLFGGHASNKPTTQSRTITPDDPHIQPFQYTWQQHGLDPATQRILCSIHFELADGTRLDNAFTYDWRLWQPHQITDAMTQAGFDNPSLWWSAPDSGERFKPITTAPDHPDWVAYIVAQAPNP